MPRAGDRHPRDWTVIRVKQPARVFRATRTVTFVAPKVGFSNGTAKGYLGEITVADIGCPRELMRKRLLIHQNKRRESETG